MHHWPGQFPLSLLSAPCTRSSESLGYYSARPPAPFQLRLPRKQLTASHTAQADPAQSTLSIQLTHLPSSQGPRCAHPADEVGADEAAASFQSPDTHAHRDRTQILSWPLQMTATMVQSLVTTGTTGLAVSSTAPYI